MTRRPDTWMPIYWGDYARDTGHLNNAGHGAYMMLIKHYWCSGEPLSDDDNELWRIACCDSKKHWLKLRPGIVRLFVQISGKLSHKRIDREIEHAETITNAKAEAGKRGAEARWQKDGSRIAEPPVRQRQTDTPSPSPSHLPTEESSLRSDISREALNEGALFSSKPSTSKPNPAPGERGSGRKAQVPEDWRPDAGGMKFAADRSIDAKVEVPRFVDNHRSKGNTFADIAAAWRTWCQSPYVTKIGMPRAGPARQTAASGWAERYGLLNNSPASNTEFDIEGFAE